MINTYNESMLHHTLKEIYAMEGNGDIEQKIDGFVCDAVWQNNTIVEIQTKNLSALKSKLERLLLSHTVKVIHPIAVCTYLKKYDEKGILISQRKSPKKRTIYSMFRELTGIYPLLLHPHFTLEIVFITQTEVRTPAQISGGYSVIRNIPHKTRWKKEFNTSERILESIEEKFCFTNKNDYIALLPVSLGEKFTVFDVKKTEIGTHASIFLWVLKKMDIIEVIEKRERMYVYGVVKKDENKKKECTFNRKCSKIQ